MATVPPTGSTTVPKPSPRILAVYTLLVCDPNLCNEVYGTSLDQWNPEAIFKRYPKLDRKAFEPSLSTIKNAGKEVRIAGKEWFKLAQETYTGPACPDVSTLTNIAVHIQSL
jgi:hypothetical protein